MSAGQQGCCGANEKAAEPVETSCCGGAAPSVMPHEHHQHEHHDHAAHTEKDPVCGMSVDPRETAHHAEHGGQSYHFCAQRCR
jgi:Cu+-exporting ATPase